MKLNHLSFPTKNVVEEAKFFERYFGTVTEHVHAESGSAMIKHKDVDIVLDSVHEEVNWHPRFHFGFEFETKKEVEELYEKLKIAGVKIETEIFNFIGRGSRFFGRTPGGIQFEVNTREDAEEKYKPKRD